MKTIKEKVIDSIEFMKKQVDKEFSMYLINAKLKDKDGYIVFPLNQKGDNRTQALNEEVKVLTVLGEKLAKEGAEVQSIICMAEAWLSVADKGTDPTTVIPSKDPKRKEVVICSGSDMDNHKYLMSIEIKSQEFEGRVVRTLDKAPLDNGVSDEFESVALKAFVDSYNKAKKL